MYKKFEFEKGSRDRNKNSEDDFLEFSYVVKVPLHVLLDQDKSRRKYKYHVESSLTQQGVIRSLEFIAGVSNARGAVIDRYLKLHVDLNLIKNQTEFICKHYDGIIMPEIVHKNLNTNVGRGAKTKAKAMKKLAAIFKSKKESSASSSDEQGLIDIKSLSHSQHVELRKSALTFYLNSLCDILYGTKSMEDPVSIVQTIHAIFATLHNSYVHFHGNEADWKFQETVEAMYEFLTSTVADLMTAIKTNPEFTFVMKILVLLLIFSKCGMLHRFSQSNHSAISCLLKNLAVKDESSLRIISTGFFVHYQKSIQWVLEVLISNSVKFKQPVIEWMFAVPLLHFVMKKCKPYDELEGMTWDYDDLTKQVDTISYIVCNVVSCG